LNQLQNAYLLNFKGVMTHIRLTINKMMLTIMSLSLMTQIIRTSFTIMTLNMTRLSIITLRKMPLRITIET